MKETPPKAETVIKRLGGTAKVAKMFDISMASVSEWKRPDKGIPKPRMMYIKAVHPEVLAPDDNSEVKHA